MAPVHQRIGATALDELEHLNRHRGLISAIYARVLDHKIRSAENSPPFLRFPVLVDNQNLAGQLMQLGVRRLYPRALCDLEALQPKLAPGKAKTPGAQDIARRLVTLPTHTKVDVTMAQRIVGEVQKVFEEIEIIERK